MPATDDDDDTETFQTHRQPATIHEHIFGVAAESLCSVCASVYMDDHLWTTALPSSHFYLRLACFALVYLLHFLKYQLYKTPKFGLKHV